MIEGCQNLGFAPEGQGWRMTQEGVTALDGDFPVNASGGVLSSNPIGASGLIRFAEAALQVRGKAGQYQVDGAKKAMGHAYVEELLPDRHAILMQMQGYVATSDLDIQAHVRECFERLVAEVTELSGADEAAVRDAGTVENYRG